jgi:hypothetical protein
MTGSLRSCRCLMDCARCLLAPAPAGGVFHQCVNRTYLLPSGAMMREKNELGPRRAAHRTLMPPSRGWRCEVWRDREIEGTVCGRFCSYSDETQRVMCVLLTGLVERFFRTPSLFDQACLQSLQLPLGGSELAE